ncbi:MAG TPA: adenylate/guanylate cyclase domain-containing protein [Burkholderiales bacterium]
MMDRPNRTFISSVLFLDIVGYSKLPVTEQIRIKEQFNSLVSHLITDIPEADRIVLDTGDGAALSFLGDPEDALFVAVKLRDAIKEKQAHEFPDLHLRMGINLGPVKLLKDINGRPNLIGDGINVAQRVMNFAQPDQILVSRSFYDVVSCLSDEYRELFADRGTHTDKHVREHELYEIGFVDPDRSVTLKERMQELETRTRIPEDQLLLLENELRPHVGEHAHVLVQANALGAADFASLRNTLATYVAEPAARAAFLQVEPGQPPRKVQRKPWLVPALLVAACVVALTAWFVLHSFGGSATPEAVAGDNAKAAADTPPAAVPAANAAPAPAAASTSAPPAAEQAPPEPSKPEHKKAERKPKEPAKDSKNTKNAPVQVTPPAAAPPAAPAPAPVARSGTLRFQISGNGDAYVDGVRAGSSRVAVTPGEHRIEVRDCGFPPITKHQTISVEANDTRLIVISCMNSSGTS